MKVKHLALMLATLWASGAALAQGGDKELETTLRLVVMINAQLGAAPVFGAGVVFGREKDRLYVLTANHVVRRGDREATGIRVTLRSNPAKPLAARLLPQSDRELDVAVLAVENVASQGVDVCALSLDRLGDPAALRRGSDVYPVGNPNGAPWGMPVRPDQVSMVTGDEVAFQSPYLAVGDSGGALLDANSRLVGVVRKDEPPYGLALSLIKALQAVAQLGLPVQLWRAEKNGSTPLHKAAGADAARVKALLGEPCVDVKDVNLFTETGMTPLHYAAAAGNVEAVGLLLHAGAKVNAKMGSKLTPLEEAAFTGGPVVVKLLLDAGADVNGEHWDSITPLYNAVRGGNLEVVKLLLDHKAEVNTADYRYSPLGLAVEKGTPEMVAVLIGAGADGNAAEEDRFVLNTAAQRGDVAIVKQLLAAGSKVNALSRGYASALEQALTWGHLDVMRLLLSAGADTGITNDFDQTPLHVAAAKGMVEAMKLLLAAGASVDAKGHQSAKTPLDEAVNEGSPGAVELLLASGASLRAKKSGSGTPLCLAYQWKDGTGGDRRDRTERRQILKMLIEHAGPGDALAGDSCQVFNSAAREGDVDTVKTLLAAGANPANPNAKESYALASAAEAGNVEIVKLLIAAKANINAKDINGYSVLHLALGAQSQRRHEPPADPMECARLLLIAGAKANTVVSHHSETPLHEAVRNLSPVEIIKLLMAAGGDPNARNERGETPISIAVGLKENEIVALLRSNPPRSRKQ